QDPRERPPEQRAAADNAHAQFVDYNSEFVGILKLWKAYQDAHEELTQSQLRKWCAKNFLGFLRMREWRELHRQLKVLVQELGWKIEPEAPGPGAPGSDPDGADVRRTPAQYANLHRAVLAGLPTQVGHRIPPPAKSGTGRKPGERRPPAEYEGPRGRRFGLFPGSWLIRKPPPWLLSATLLDTEKVWAMTNASIEPQWVIDEL